MELMKTHGQSLMGMISSYSTEFYHEKRDLLNTFEKSERE
jgi:hypothetical protein